MSRFKYIVFNDPHLSSTAPSSRRLDDYEDACFNKLEQIADLAREHRVNSLMCTGDWFHKKNPAAVPYKLVNRLWRWLDTVPVPVFTVAGNHDVRFADTSPESRDGQPFGVIANHPMLRVLAPRNVVHVYNTPDTRPSPQGELFSNCVALTGSHFAAPRYDEGGEPFEPAWQFESTYVKYQPYEFIIHLCHASVVPDVPIWRPYTLVDDVFRATEANIVHCGHIHDDVGIFKGTNKRGKDAYFTNIGSITRGSLNEETLNRVPQVLLVDVSLETSLVQLQRITLAHKPHAEIYDLGAYATRKEERAVVKEWSSKVRNELLKTTGQKEETVEEIISRSDILDHPARELARSIFLDSE